MRWLRSRQGQPEPPGDGSEVDVTLRNVSHTGQERLAEGVYCEMSGRTLHFVLDGATTPICGLTGVVIYRWASAWFKMPQDHRCPTCDPQVGERGNGRHGRLTHADVLTFGWDSQEGVAQREAYQRALDRFRQDSRAQWREPEPWVPGTTFQDPPFLLLEDPEINRRRFATHMTNRVLNDVYLRPRTGKKWHRVYAVDHAYRRIGGLEEYGRGFIFPCGGAASEYEPRDAWRFAALPIRAEIPPTSEICKACAQSDAKYGKGEIPNTARWDR